MVGAVVGDWAATARPQLAHGSTQVGVSETSPPAIQPPPRRLQPWRGGRRRGGISEDLLLVMGGCTDGRRWLGRRWPALRSRALIPIMSHCSPNCVFRDGVAHPTVRSRNDAGGISRFNLGRPATPTKEDVMFGVKTARKLLLTAVVAALATMPVAAESSSGNCKYSKKYIGLFCGDGRDILSCTVAGAEEGDPDTCWVNCGRAWVKVNCQE